MGAQRLPECAAVPASFEHPRDAAQFKRLHREGIELYQAHIVRFAFDPHVHEGFGLGAIESGVERFRYRGSEHLAPAESVVLMNPDVLHTGRAETPQGWRYRMIYIEPEIVEAVTGERGWWFAEPVAHEPAVARRIHALMALMWRTDDALARDGALMELLDAVRPLARGARTPDAAHTHADAALDRAVALMHDRLAEPLSLDDLAREAGLSPFHFQRRFKARHHATPHQVLMALRLFRAKALLGVGAAPAAVAVDVGLVDQSHLTRRFARMYGVTPGRYQQQLGRRASR
jgi:AraC-like DNA-binding protein